VTLTERKVPVLGDIPLLGALFRRRERTKQKRNLILFLTPYVVRDQSDLRRIFERKMQERQEFLDRYFVFGDQEYEPPVDYSRTRGLVLEIINEVDAIAVERQILEDARGIPPPEHVPRAPIGTIEPGEARPAEGDVVIVPDGAENAPPGGPPDVNSPTPELPQILVQPRDPTETP
jgi:general secretion pathway protein D